jgi:hypothetical protein
LSREASWPGEADEEVAYEKLSTLLREMIQEMLDELRG